MKSELSREEQEIVNDVALVIFALLQTIETATWDQVVETVNAQPVIARKITSLGESKQQEERFPVGVVLKLVHCRKVELTSVDGIRMQPRDDGRMWEENDFKIYTI